MPRQCTTPISISRVTPSQCPDAWFNSVHPLHMPQRDANVNLARVMSTVLSFYFFFRPLVFFHFQVIGSFEGGEGRGAKIMEGQRHLEMHH